MEDDEGTIPSRDDSPERSVSQEDNSPPSVRQRLEMTEERRAKLREIEVFPATIFTTLNVLHHEIVTKQVVDLRYYHC